MATKVTLDQALADDEDQEHYKAKAPASAASQNRQTSSTKKTGPVKLTIELEPELHHELKRFALLEAEDASLASLIRAAVVVMTQHERYAKAVIKEAANQKRRRGTT